MWRKLTGAWTSNSWAPTLKPHVGERQYGVGTSNGSVLMAHDINADLAQHEGWAVAHLDLLSAFTSIHRKHLVEALHQVDARLLASQRHWVKRASPVLIATSHTTASVHQVESGVPQGDPFSSWAFAAILQSAIHNFIEMMKLQGLEESSDYSIRCYVDDVALAAPVASLPAIIAAWQSALEPLHLILQPQKMQVYQEGASPQWLADHFGCQVDQCSGEGLVICGLPLGSSPDSLDIENLRPEIPVGSVLFQQRYLQKRLEQLRYKARTLEGIADGLPSIGRHVAVHILHSSLLASCMYLLRGLHLDATLPWSVCLDELFQNSWLRLCNVHQLSMAQWQLVTASPALGGLGLLRLRLETPLHALAQALAIRALRSSQSMRNRPWTLSEQRAIDQCSQSMNVSATLQRSMQQLEEEGYLKAMRKLRTAQPFPEGYCPGDVSRRLFILSSAHATKPEVDITERQQRAASVTWYTQPDGRYLNNDVLQASLRDRLELPLFEDGVLCEYITRSSNRICSMPLGRHGQHACNCCHALTQARHHALRDWARDQLEKVGDHAILEQAIMVKQGPQLPDVQAPELWHRADIAGLSGTGMRTLYDIAVVTSPIGGDARWETNRVEVSKFAVYGASHANTSNSMGDKVQPIVFHATAGLGHTAQSFCWQLAGRIIERAARDPHGMTTQPLSRIQSFFALCSEALRVLKEGHYRVLRASGSMVWQ